MWSTFSRKNKRKNKATDRQQQTDNDDIDVHKMSAKKESKLEGEGFKLRHPKGVEESGDFYKEEETTSDKKKKVFSSLATTTTKRNKHTTGKKKTDDGLQKKKRITTKDHDGPRHVEESEDFLINDDEGDDDEKLVVDDDLQKKHITTRDHGPIHVEDSGDFYNDEDDGNHQYPGAFEVAGMDSNSSEGNDDSITFAVTAPCQVDDTPIQQQQQQEVVAITVDEDEMKRQWRQELMNEAPQATIYNPTDDLAEEEQVLQQQQEEIKKELEILRKKKFYFTLLILLLIVIVGVVVGVTVPLLSKSNKSTPTNSSDSPRTSSEPTATNVTQWKQVGNDINGVNDGDYSGSSVSISSSGNIVVVGAPAEKKGQPGTCRVYKLNSTNEWGEFGQLLKGNATDEDRFGSSVSINDSGTVIAVGAPRNDNRTGSVYIYNFNNSSSSNHWEIIQVLHGDSDYDSFGGSLTLSGDGTTLAIGATQCSYFFNAGDKCFGNGYVKVYKRNEIDNSWYQVVNTTLNGASFGDMFGNSVALDKTGTGLIVGAPHNGDNGDKSGKVYIYKYSNSSSNWDSFGNNNDLLKGDYEDDRFGDAVTSSANGEIIAVVAVWNNGTNLDKEKAGTVKMLKLNTSSNKYEQLGNNIDGENEKDESGSFEGVSLSDSGMIVAIGSWLNNDNGDDSGSVRIYEYVSNKWTKISQDVDGESSNDRSGRSVSLNGNGTMVAIGASRNDGENNELDDTDRGHVRVYHRGSN